MKSKMFDKKYWEISKTMDEKHPHVFAALEEYDRTRKIPKFNYKKRIDFTIDSKILNEFRAHCRKHNLKMSNIVENLIRKELK